jgi:hypothetical protein
VEIGFSLLAFWELWQLNGARANLGVWFSRRGKVRGNPRNVLLGLGATKRRGVLSMTERHLGTLPLKDVGKKDPTNRTLYDARHVALAFCLDNIQQNKLPRHNEQLEERNLEAMADANRHAVEMCMNDVPYPTLDPQYWVENWEEQPEGNPFEEWS